MTLFSAPNYCGEFDNAGAMMSVDETLMCSFQVIQSSICTVHVHIYMHVHVHTCMLPLLCTCTCVYLNIVGIHFHNVLLLELIRPVHKKS